METQSPKGIPWLRFLACGAVIGGLALCLQFLESEGGEDVGELQGSDMRISGEVSLTKDLSVPEGATLVVKPGSRLLIGNDVRIFVDGKIVARGTPEKPIVFEGSGEGVYWRGIEIKGLGEDPDVDAYWDWIEKGDKDREDIFFRKVDSGNVFEHCVFRNAATKSRKFARKNKWKGTIEAYNTALRVSHCTFEDILFFGAVLTQRSYVVVNGCVFDDETLHKAINSTDRAVGVFCDNTISGHRKENHRCADGVWTKKSFVGLVAGNRIDTVGDDGVDMDGSRVVVYGNEIRGNWDDGIDVDNKGLCYAIKNTVTGVAENGILVSDESEAVVVGNGIEECANGLTLRDGATVVANENQILRNTRGVILFQNIPVALTEGDFESVTRQIKSFTPSQIDEMEYIDGITSPDQLIEVLEYFYVLKDGYWRFGEVDFEQVSEFDSLKKIFKLVDVLALEYVPEEVVEGHALREALKNGIYITGSTVKDNGEDIAAFHGYRLKMDEAEMEFTDDDSRALAVRQCQCEEGYTCDLVEKLNTAGVEVNARRIARRVEEQYGAARPSS
jgi:Right handed beta helix region